MVMFKEVNWIRILKKLRCV